MAEPFFLVVLCGLNHHGALELKISRWGILYTSICVHRSPFDLESFQACKDVFYMCMIGNRIGKETSLVGFSIYLI